MDDIRALYSGQPDLAPHCPCVLPDIGPKGELTGRYSYPSCFIHGWQSTPILGSSSLEFLSDRRIGDALSVCPYVFGSKGDGVRSLKIIIIGAGSASFGRGAIADVRNCTELRQTEGALKLLDINLETLERMGRFAHLLSDQLGAPVKIEASTDRRRLLPGAHYVIAAVARDRWELCQKELYIPASYGFRHADEENGGPGGRVPHPVKSAPDDFHRA